MKKEKIAKKLQELEVRINSLGDIPAKVTEVDGYLSRAKVAAEATDQEKQKSNSLLVDIQNTQQRVEVLKQNIETVGKTSTELSNFIDEQRKKSTAAEATILEHKKNMESLEESIRKQLGSTGAKVLADAFSGEADKLRKSASKWFYFVLGSSVFLFIATILIVFWELSSAGDIWSTNFLIKVTITTPIIYFVFFTARQYGREKRLLDEYSFKSSVALSFNAFEESIKGIGPEDDGNKILKILDFAINTVRNIYSSPLDDVYRHKEDDDKGVLQPAVGALDLVSAMPKKA
jgi:hypothetical protein